MAFLMRAAEVFRDFVTAGVPSSGKWKPKKSDIRVWGEWVESIISAFFATGGKIYPTRALLNADLTPAANSIAWVMEDTTVANNGIYRKVGGTGTGSWVRASDLPFSFIVASNPGAGTANAIQATTSLPTSSSALVILPVTATNTASPVTVSFNGGSALTIKSNTGNDIVSGGLVAGMIVFGVIAGSTFRILNDQVSGAIVAAAEAAAVRAETAASTFTKASDGDATAGTNDLKYMTAAKVKKEIETVGLTIDQMADSETLAAIIGRTGLTPQMVGAIPGDANHSPAINSAIDRLITAGGGTLWLPPMAGDWKIGSVINCHKSGVTGSYLTVRGVGDKARLKWLNTTGDMIKIGDGTNPVYYVTLANLYLYAGGGARTSGIDIKAVKANIIKLNDIVTDGTYAGIYGEDLNSLYGSMIHFNMPNQTSGSGVEIKSDPSGSGRTDIVKFDEVTVQAYNAGSYGLIVNGRVAGVHTDGFYALGTRRGLQLVSSSSLLANVPQFCDFRKFETDRATDVSVVIDRAYRTEFSRCEISNTSGAMDSPYPQGSADDAAFLVLAGATDTKIVGGRIGNSRQQALQIHGKNTKVIGTSLTDMSKAGVNAAAGLYLGATADGFDIRDVTVEGYGRASYAIQMEAGTKNGVIRDTIYKDVVTGYSAGTGTNVDNNGQKLATYTY